MTTPEVRIDPATLDDCRLTYGWANDPGTRAGSFHTEEIRFDQHEHWFRASVERHERWLGIVRVAGVAVGIVRFDPLGSDPEVAEVGITVAPEQRNRRLATPMLEAAMRRATTLGFKTLVARIKIDHESSRRAFERAGFSLAGREEVAGFAALRYEWIAA